MAKKKKTARRRVTRKPKTTRRRTLKRSSGLNDTIKTGITAGFYGAVRGTLSNYLKPFTAKIPAGDYADELGLIVVSHFAKKGTFGKQFKEIGKAGLVVESAVLGRSLAENKLNFGGSANTENSTTGVIQY